MAQTTTVKTYTNSNHTHGIAYDYNYYNDTAWKENYATSYAASYQVNYTIMDEQEYVRIVNSGTGEVNIAPAKPERFIPDLGD